MIFAKLNGLIVRISCLTQKDGERQKKHIVYQITRDLIHLFSYFRVTLTNSEDLQHMGYELWSINYVKIASL